MMSKPRLPVYDEEWLETAHILRTLADIIEEHVQEGDAKSLHISGLTANDRTCIATALAEAYRIGNIPKSN